jgi:hypothetical protein
LLSNAETEKGQAINGITLLENHLQDLPIHVAGNILTASLMRRYNNDISSAPITEVNSSARVVYQFRYTFLHVYYVFHDAFHETYGDFRYCYYILHLRLGWQQRMMWRSIKVLCRITKLPFFLIFSLFLY